MPMLYSMCGISPMEWRDVMGIMPAHHGGVLKNLDEGKGVKVGLSLWATKETARAVYWSVYSSLADYGETSVAEPF